MKFLRRSNFVIVALLLGGSPSGFAQPSEPALALAIKEKPALLQTLRELVSIESGSRDYDGLSKLAASIAGRLKTLGATVEVLEARDVYKMEDTPEKIGRMVRATFTGKGTKKILLLAHMDTVYARGMLANDKQGIAVILHTMAILQAMKYREYGTVTVLINADEEISSPGSRASLAKLGAEHDAVFSLEASRAESDKISLATSGIAAVTLTVKGRASHSGQAPEKGVNALYELAHQILQTREFSDPAVGLKMNWTLASGGTTRNVIPPVAQAVADVRVLRNADYDEIEKKIREAIKKQLLPEAEVEMTFTRRRPPLQASAASRALATRAQAIYRELGRELVVDELPEGGGTDAAFAALDTKGPVIERLGLRGYGEHSANAEYVLLDSIEPRLYLLARLIMDVSQSAGQLKP
jgi:glutamate carboxypeptidase